MTSDEQLHALFEEAVDADPTRVTGGLTRDQLCTSPVVLYGAGMLGRHVAARLRRAGITPVAFADDTHAKHGAILDGLDVMPPFRVVEHFGEGVLFIVTIFNPGLKFLDARERLRRLAEGGVFSFLHLAQIFPGEFLPFGPFEPPSALAAKRDDIRRTYDLLADDESRREFVGHLRFRLHSDFAALPPNGHEGYFPRDLFPAPLSDNVRFVDCGAYDGDTIAAFLRHQHGRFSTIDAFEPDAGNFRRLAAHVASLGPDASRRIALHQSGVGAMREARSFNATGNMAAAFNPSGAARVPVVAIDDLIVPDERPVYVKYDIEGGESEALRGTSSLIRLAQPLLAISIYHRPDDLWQLPLQARALNPDYQLYVRTQGEDGTDVVCYAIPA